MTKNPFSQRSGFGGFFSEFSEFNSFFTSFVAKKIFKYVSFFENGKNTLVKLFMAKRGRYNRLFLHLSTIIVLTVGIITAPSLASTFPIFSNSGLSSKVSVAQVKQSITLDENVFHTSVSQKPRDKVVTYTVQKGDTLSTIAKKFGISEDTIRWANDLTSDDLLVGDTLQILPVTGILHKVESGDTVYSIAKTYQTNAQQIVDFPFNDFANPETFTLVAGQLLVVPDGIKPESGAAPVYRQVYIAQGPVSGSSAGLSWPLSGTITQFASWYHMALDIADPIGTPIVAAESGVVARVSVGTYDYGYGNNVWLDNGSGLRTHYAHMEAVNVSAGQSVTAGKTVVGWIGMTGRTTGPHVHFEVEKNGVLVNPISYLP
jgi:murein DD-endopeptidase MepM/ murein hydrolase activator NlpD